MVESKPLVNMKGKTNSADKKQIILCKICYTLVSAPQGNTTNLFNHRKFNHKLVYDQTIQEQKTDKSRLLSLQHSQQLKTLYNETPTHQALKDIKK